MTAPVLTRAEYAALFAPLPAPGLIIVDEEHDQSYKQDSLPRYHARDLAVVYAGQLGVPIVLGSATPSLESVFNGRQGRYQVIYFGYSFCPDVCPTTLAVMSQALDKLGGEAGRITPIFITIDPARDTPKVLGEYMKAFGPTFVGLTGSDAAIAQVEKEYRVYAKKQAIDPTRPERGYGMNHSSVIYLMGPDGRLVSFYDEAISPDDLAKDLRAKI